MKKKLRLVALLGLSLLILTACGTSTIDASSTGLWARLVYLFAETIRFLSFFDRVGIGIILFTILIRTILLPLYNMQTKSSQKMQELQPQLQAIQEKYPGRDNDSRMMLAEETNALYKANGVNPYASLLPLVIQMPILIALFQALTRVDLLSGGQFLWLDLSQPDPYYILPILAAGFTYMSTWLTNKASQVSNTMMTTMMYMMPAMIFLFALSVASGVALYWTVSNAYQVVQTLIFNNPFKIIAEREEKARQEKEREAKIRRAKKKARKKRK